jgi:thioredoxin 1
MGMSVSKNKHFTTSLSEGPAREEMAKEITKETAKEMPAPGAIRSVTRATFSQSVLQASGPILVEFMSYGCAHCREMEPVLRQVAERMKSQVEIFRVNTAIERELTESYQVQGTPTLIRFLRGQEVARVEGPEPTVESVMEAVTS